MGEQFKCIEYALLSLSHVASQSSSDQKYFFAAAISISIPHLFAPCVLENDNNVI